MPAMSGVALDAGISSETLPAAVLSWLCSRILRVWPWRRMRIGPGTCACPSSSRVKPQIGIGEARPGAAAGVTLPDRAHRSYTQTGAVPPMLESQLVTAREAVLTDRTAAWMRAFKETLARL